MGETLQRLNTRFGAFFKHYRVAAKLLSALIVFSMFFAVAWGRLDSDFGWHLITGNHILAHGIPRSDSYTYTAQGHPWVDHEWGNDLILALVYRAGGYLLSAIFFSAIWTAAVFIFGWRSRFWIIFVAALAIMPYAGIRPIAWSVLLFAGVLKLLQSNQRKHYWLVPFIFLPWANLHAGFIAGLGLIAYYAVIKRSRSLGLILLFSGLVTLINPYGIGLYGEVARTVFDSNIHNQISEWRRFYLTTPSMPYVILWVLGLAFYARRQLSALIGPGTFLFAASLAASRNIPLFVAGTIKDLDIYWKSLVASLPERKYWPYRLIYGLSTVALVLIVAIAAYVEIFPFSGRLSAYPVQEVAYLKTNPCLGNLFAPYNYGGYLEWQLPSTKEYIDGRMVTWTPYMNQYLSLINHPKTQLKPQFSKYHISCALLPDSSYATMKAMLMTEGWKKSSTGNGFTLYESPLAINS